VKVEPEALAQANNEFVAGAQKGASPGEPRWDGVSQLKGKTKRSDLQRIAKDSTAAREKRAEAIFSLLANHTKLPQDASSLGKLLNGKNWLHNTNLYGVYGLGGWIPVDLAFKDTVFCLHLFPDKKGWSDWVIYFRLSGGSGRSAEDGRAFLLGTENLKGRPSLVEFALCFPATGEDASRRIERFSEKGIQVYKL